MEHFVTRVLEKMDFQPLQLKTSYMIVWKIRTFYRLRVKVNMPRKQIGQWRENGGWGGLLMSRLNEDTLKHTLDNEADPLFVYRTLFANTGIQHLTDTHFGSQSF